MTLIILVVVAIALFVTGIVSPHAAGKIQYTTDKKAGWLKRGSTWLWSPFAWWAKNSVEMTRKIIKTVAQWGKRTRRKLPF